MITIAITCDKCGKASVAINNPPIAFLTITDVKESARMRGWSIGKQHLCPNCRPKPKTK